MKNITVTDKVVFLMYKAYFILIPFYFWGSGLPQVADLIMVLLLIVYLLKSKMKVKFKIEKKYLLVAGLSFVSYVIFINSIWVFLTGYLSSFGINIMYYMHNYMILVLFILLYSEYGKDILRLIYSSVIASIFIEVFLFFVSFGYTGGRMTGTFNNPNQLGYFALLTGAILIVLSNKIKVNYTLLNLALSFNILLIVFSLSTTTIFAYTFLMFFYLLSGLGNKNNNIFLLTIGVVILMLIIENYTTIFEDSLMIKSLQNRLNTIEGKTSNIVDDRGYNLLVEHPQHLVFGAGEGYFQRFGRGIEIHSLLGNIQFSYGLIGSGLFLRTLYAAVRNNKFENWYILVSILIYGITHNGIRSGLLWTLLGLMTISGD